MLGKITDLDPLDRIEIKELLWNIEEALSDWNASEIESGRNTTFQSEMKEKEAALSSLQTLRSFLLG